jgi:hypothetical protein
MKWTEYHMIKLLRKGSEPIDERLVYSYDIETQVSVFTNKNDLDRLKKFGIVILTNGAIGEDNRKASPPFKVKQEGFHQAFFLLSSKLFDMDFFEWKLFNPSTSTLATKV